MIHVECELSELKEFFQEVGEAKVEAARLQVMLDTAQTALKAKEDECRGLKQEMQKNKAMTTATYTTASGGLVNAQTISDLLKTASTANKLGAIKMVRTVLGYGLKEAKDLVEASLGQPYIF